MGTGRKFRRKPRTRPTKPQTERRRRDNVHRRRLVALGMPEEAVRRLNSRQMRELLKRPAEFSKQA